MRILVALMDEGSDAWYPVEANHVSDDLYLIIGENPDPEDLHWEFRAGMTVRCRQQKMGDGETHLVAFEAG
jgi:hypothetical protein